MLRIRTPGPIIKGRNIDIRRHLKHPLPSKFLFDKIYHDLKYLP